MLRFVLTVTIISAAKIDIFPDDMVILFHISESNALRKWPAGRMYGSIDTLTAGKVDRLVVCLPTVKTMVKDFWVNFLSFHK